MTTTAARPTTWQEIVDLLMYHFGDLDQEVDYLDALYHHILES